MIKYYFEGERISTGINIGFRPGGLQICLAWVDLLDLTLIKKRVRFRCHVWPFLLYTSDTVDLFDLLMSRGDFVVIHRTHAEGRGCSLFYRMTRGIWRFDREKRND